MADDAGQITETHSISAGLDYPGVGPEHAWLKDSGRVSYVTVNDDAAMAAFHELSRMEGIMPALETAHAVAYARELASRMEPEQSIVINLSGRGDKDMDTVARYSGESLA
jgi:tryptophan synthase beta chain